MTDTNMPRVPNDALRDYVKRVNAEMQARFGVTYMDIRDDLPGGLNRVRDAAASGTSPAKFVDETAEKFGFKPAAPGFGMKEAQIYNKYQAALVAWTGENPGWIAGADGIYGQSSAG